ncbi:MAG: aminotransferase class I/II-fold pyridoxal phosphate-dependent enzyme [Lachnospiraceae bacterium]|nr:aminotransferase class I/II-fold pyridoxal phosphate-dependent enzyme [Lachnospiraceae bacterium]
MIPLSVPNLTGNEKKYLIDCIDSTFVSSVGEYVNRFESMTAEATGSRYAVATSSGTTGIHAALTAAGVTYGDLVVIPTFTFIASANSVKHCGADPYLMDISADSWCLSPEAVRDNLAKKCRRENGMLVHAETGRRIAALMPVYTLGNIPDMEAFREIADEYTLPLIVDAACAAGATYKGGNIGPLADVSILSFNGNKTITCGGGGAAVGNDEKLLGHIRHLTTTARVWPDYDFDEAGFNYRMTNIQAAVGCAQMENLGPFVKTKRRIRTYYEERLSALKEVGISFFPTTPGSSCWFSGIVLPEGTDFSYTKKLCADLKDKGIEAKTFWKPVHLQKPYAGAPCEDVRTAEGLWQRLIALPCSTGISDEELETVSRTVTALLA